MPDAGRLQRWEPRRQPFADDLKDPLWALDVLQPMAPEIAEDDSRRQVVLDQLACRVRDEYLSAVTHCADPGGAMHANARVALLADDGLARVNAHSHLDGSFFGPRMGGELALRFQGGCDRVARSAERDEEGISLCVDLVSVMICARGTQDHLMFRERSLIPLAEGLHQVCRAFDVGEEEGDGSARRSGPALM